LLFRSGVDDGENDFILAEIVILINAAVLFELGPSRPKFRGRSAPEWGAGQTGTCAMVDG